MEGLAGSVSRYVENIKNLDLTKKDLEEIGHRTFELFIQALTISAP